MALSDYYCCDICGSKCFYDAEIDWDCQDVGDMKCICAECKESGYTIKIEKQDENKKDKMQNMKEKDSNK